MLIQYAFAQDAAAGAPPASEMFFMNFLLIGVLILLMYVLMIRPQQRRIREHRDMLGSLKKGERVVTSGGLVGSIDDNSSDNEVVLDIGDKNKVIVLRSAISGRYEDIVTANPEAGSPKNDNKKDEDNKKKK